MSDTKPRPTIAQLEAILADTCPHRRVDIAPDGQVTTVDTFEEVRRQLDEARGDAAAWREWAKSLAGEPTREAVTYLINERELVGVKAIEEAAKARIRERAEVLDEVSYRWDRRNEVGKPFSEWLWEWVNVAREALTGTPAAPAPNPPQPPLPQGADTCDVFCHCTEDCGKPLPDGIGPLPQGVEMGCMHANLKTRSDGSAECRDCGADSFDMLGEEIERHPIGAVYAAGIVGSSAPQAPAIGLADVIRGALCRVLGIGRDEEIALATKTIVADIEYRKPATGLDAATVEACAELVEGEPYGESVHTIAARIRALASSREGAK